MFGFGRAKELEKQLKAERLENIDLRMELSRKKTEILSEQSRNMGLLRAIYDLEREIEFCKKLSHTIGSPSGLKGDIYKRIYKAGFKKLCTELHPDKPKGSHEAFLALKEAYDKLMK